MGTWCNILNKHKLYNTCNFLDKQLSAVHHCFLFSRSLTNPTQEGFQEGNEILVPKFLYQARQSVTVVVELTTPQELGEHSQKS